MSYDHSNIFARILRREIPGEIVFEDDVCLAIMDVMPRSRGHCLVISKAPVINVLDCSPTLFGEISCRVARIAQASRSAFEADGVVVQQNSQSEAGQEVFHLHFHVLPRYAGDPLKPPGMAGETEQITLDGARLREVISLWPLKSSESKEA